MSEKNGHEELHLKYRPRKLADVVGQPAAVKTLQGFFDKGTVPHALLLHGYTGTGKTTLARIVAKKLGCETEEVNCAICDPMETIKSIDQRRRVGGLGGAKRAWILDEFQALSRSSFSQQATLKMLEEPEPHCYYFLCTTDPEKILKAIRTRCTPIPLRRLSKPELEEVVVRALERSGGTTDSNSVIAKIAEKADGSAREALVLLGKVLQVGEGDQLATLDTYEEGHPAIEIARLLMKPKCSWKEIAKLLKDMTDDHEAARRIILGYASAVLLNGADNPRAGLILEVFRTHNYDCARPGLVQQAYEVFKSGA